jgi:hypothetical protein
MDRRLLRHRRLLCLCRRHDPSIVDSG